MGAHTGSLWVDSGTAGGTGQYEFVSYHVTVTLLFSGAPDPLGRTGWPCPRRSQ